MGPGAGLERLAPGLPRRELAAGRDRVGAPIAASAPSRASWPISCAAPAASPAASPASRTASRAPSAASRAAASAASPAFSTSLLPQPSATPKPIATAATQRIRMRMSGLLEGGMRSTCPG